MWHVYKSKKSQSQLERKFIMIILHASDFHFSAIESDFESAKEKLFALADTIKASGIKVDVFVFTGDLIDAPSIAKKAARQVIKKKKFDNYDMLQTYLATTSEEDKKIFCDKKLKITQAAYKKATDALKDFLKEIGITDNQKFIACCGNHDVFRGESFPEFDCKEHGKNFDIEKYNINFDLFQRAYNDLTTVKSYPFVREIDGYNFLVIDSNIITKNKKACIQCSELIKQLNTLDSAKRGKNIAISHKPVFDYCENAVINYDGDINKQTVRELINEKCSFILCGDKHSRYVNRLLDGEEMLFGSPLTSNVIHYNILNTDAQSGNVKEYRFVFWNSEKGKNDKESGKWNISTLNSKVILEYCSKYISSFASQFIGEVNLHSITTLKYNYVEQLFKNIVQLRNISDEFNDNIERGNLLESISLYLNNVYDAANKYKYQKRLNLFNLRGRPSTGKTFFLNCLFFYLVKEFNKNNTKYVPMYINLNIILKQCKNSYEEYYELAKQQFDEFLTRCDEVHRMFDVEILCIVDGLESKNYYDPQSLENNIENYIVDTLNAREQFKYILSFDLTIVPLASNNLQQYKLFCEFVLYFRRFDVVNLYSSNISNKFEQNAIQVTNDATKQQEVEQNSVENPEKSILNTLDAYFAICPYKNANNSGSKEAQNSKNDSQSPNFPKTNNEKQEIEQSIYSKNALKSILNFHITNINFLFLHRNIDYLVNDKSNFDVTNGLLDILDKRHAEIYSECKNNGTFDLCVVAYKYYIHGKTFKELEQQYHITFHAFYSIKNDEELLQYLTAIYYIKAMHTFSNCTQKGDIDTSIFNVFIPRNISLMMRLYIDRNNMLPVVIRFLDYLVENKIKVHYQTKSLLYYLTGFLKSGSSLPLVDSLKVDKDFDVELTPEMKKFNEYCVERSGYIARIVSCGDVSKRNKLKRQFINRLFSDSEFRNINRVILSLYYGDNTFYGQNGKEFSPTKDIVYKGFDFYYLFLTLIAKYDFARKKNNDFKDYILIELDLFSLCDFIFQHLQSAERYDESGALYYSSRYRDKAKASLIRISDALDTVLKCSTLRDNPRLADYFSAMRTVFLNAAKNIDSTTPQYPYGSPIKLINDEFNSFIPRCPQDCSCSYNAHIMAAYIAMLFLPNFKKGGRYKKYDKNLVVSLLLLKNMNTLKNDAQSDDYDIIRILAMDQPCGFGDLMQYYNCMQQKNSASSDINLIVANDILEIAQQFTENKGNSSCNDKCSKHFSKICEPIYNQLILQNGFLEITETMDNQLRSEFLDPD